MIDVSKASNPPESFEFPDLSDLSREELIKILNGFIGEVRSQQFISDSLSETRREDIQCLILMSAVFFTGRISIDNKRIEILKR